MKKEKWYCITKIGKNWKQVKWKKLVSVIYPRGGAETLSLKSICCFLLLLFYVFILFYFCLFFVYGCVIISCGSFLSLIWCYLIKNEINISKKKKKIMIIIKNSIYVTSFYSLFEVLSRKDYKLERTFKAWLFVFFNKRYTFFPNAHMLILLYLTLSVN